MNKTALICLMKWEEVSNPPLIKGKGSWTVTEDAVLTEKQRLFGRKWAKIATFLPGRQGKQCRERFVNHLDPELKKGHWTDDEEAILISLHERYGNRWAGISKHLAGRSDNEVKNHWYSTIQRKFQQHGRKVGCYCCSVSCSWSSASVSKRKGSHRGGVLLMMTLFNHEPNSFVIVFF